VLWNPHLDFSPTHVDGAEAIGHHLDVEFGSTNFDGRVRRDDLKVLFGLEMDHRDVDLAIGDVHLLVWRPSYLSEMRRAARVDRRKGRDRRETMLVASDDQRGNRGE
jgi:hypothetical protein